MNTPNIPAIALAEIERRLKAYDEMRSKQDNLISAANAVLNDAMYDDPSYQLAMLIIQSEAYHGIPGMKDATDLVFDALRNKYRKED